MDTNNEDSMSMMSKTKTTRVRIGVRTVGQSFGVEGVIKALNGRVLATTDTRPLGHRVAALEAAEALAARRGYEVVR